MQIWKGEKEDIYKLNKISEKQIEEAEQALDVKLPGEYIKLILEQNGGEIIYNAHPLPHTTTEYVSINHFMGIGKENGLLENDYLLKEWEMPKGLILLSGDGHTWTALDYRLTKEDPTVVYVDNEGQEIVTIARSFREFLTGLYIEEDQEDYGADFPDNDWTLEEVEAAFKSDSEQDIILAFDYLVENADEHANLMEETLLNLLQHPSLEIKQMAANMAHHFNEEGLVSSAYIIKIKKVLQQDESISYYDEMFFSQRT